MAEKKSSRKDELGIRANEPKLSHSFDDQNLDQQFEDEGEEASDASGKKSFLDAITKNPWIKKNPNLAKGIAAGVLLLLMLLFFGWQLGWFGGSGKKSREMASEPAPSQSAPPSSSEPLPPSGRPVTPSAQKADEAKKDDSKKEKDEDRPIPDDVSKWKKNDYYRARLENDPRLLKAVEWLGEKARGSEPAAQGLTDLLKPLPTEPPPGAKPAAPNANPPMPGAPQTVPGARPAPGGPQAAPGSRPAPGAVPMAPAGTPAKPPVVRPRNQAELTKLVEAIIAALGENDTPLARSTLEKVISGEQSTDDDKAAVIAALKALVLHPGPENNAMLLKVLLTPEEVRPAERLEKQKTQGAQGTISAKEMWTKAFEFVKPAASVELRTKIAEILAPRMVRLTASDPVREFLMAADPLNVGAQAFLYEKISVKDIKTKLEQQLISYSSLALSRLIGFPDNAAQVGGGMRLPTAGVAAVTFGKTGPAAPGRPGTSDKIEVQVDPVPSIAALLWSEKFRARLESQLEDLRSFEKQPQLVLLAATIPQDSTREAMSKTLQKHWNDGPKTLETAGLFDRTVTDPALLVLVKMGPRKDSKAPGGGRTPGAPAPRGGKPGRPATGKATSGKAADAAKANQKKEQAEQEWMTASSKLLLTLCKRFHAAALAKENAAAEAGEETEAAVKLPEGLELNKDAKAVGSYHVVWPDKAPEAIADLKPSQLEIHYVRAEETGKPKKVMAFYARQAQVRANEARQIEGNKTAWLDGMKADTKTGRRRTIDVLISRADNKTGDLAKEEEEVDFNIEILSIEIKDPGGREGGRD